MFEVTGLYCYPIKSCGRVVLEQAVLTEQGIQHDRQWMLVDEAGRFLSQREHPEMGLIAVDIDSSGRITVTHKQSQLTFSAEDCQSTLNTQVWHDEVEAQVAHNDISHWFSQALRRKCQLVRYGHSSHRLIDPEFNPLGQTVAFADGFPLLVTHQATLDLLNQQLVSQDHAQVSMQRFRPNVVVKSKMPAQDEYRWLELFNDQIQLALPKPCSRCQITNLDPKTGQKTGNTVLSTLAKHHRIGNKAIFGINATVLKTGTLSLGDDLQLVYQPSTE